MIESTKTPWKDTAAGKATLFRRDLRNAIISHVEHWIERRSSGFADYTPGSAKRDYILNDRGNRVSVMSFLEGKTLLFVIQSTKEAGLFLALPTLQTITPINNITYLENFTQIDFQFGP